MGQGKIRAKMAAAEMRFHVPLGATSLTPLFFFPQVPLALIQSVKNALLEPSRIRSRVLKPASRTPCECLGFLWVASWLSASQTTSCDPQGVHEQLFRGIMSVCSSEPIIPAPHPHLTVVVKMSEGKAPTARLCYEL